MVDLQTQYQRIKEDIDRGIQSVIDSTSFIKGPAVASFQANLEEYTGAKHVIPVGNGTDALQIALMALGLKPGDEVITPTFTFIATAEVVALLGLKPVVVDVDWDTMNISIDALRQAITPKTKAIVPVHLFGQCADMEAIMEIAKEHNLYVIEDACQAIGSVYTFADGTQKQAATIGDIGCTSFFPSKNLGCYGDGGAIFTNDDELAAKMRAIANHGMVVRYYHDTVGVNSRLDSIQAAIWMPSCLTSMSILLRVKRRQLITTKHLPTIHISCHLFAASALRTYFINTHYASSTWIAMHCATPWQRRAYQQ